MVDLTAITTPFGLLDEGYVAEHLIRNAEEITLRVVITDKGRAAIKEKTDGRE